MAESQGFLGAGDVYINRQVGGVNEGWKGPYEATRFEIKANSELREKISKGRGTYGQVIASAAVPQPFDFNLTFGALNSDGIALAMLGTVAALNQASGTLTAEDMVADLGVWVPLTKAALTGSQTVTNSAASTTYVLGTDYIVNKQLGWIKALSTGAITDAQALKVTSTYAAITGKEIKGAVNPVIRAQFKFDGINFADGKPTIVNIFEAVISSDAAIDFLSDDFAEIPLPGRMVTPVGFNEPFTIQLRDSA